MSRLSCYFLFLVAGLGCPVAWTPCLTCLANKRLCLASGTCGQCQRDYVEVSNRCVGKHHFHAYLLDGQMEELSDGALEKRSQHRVSRSTDEDVNTVEMLKPSKQKHAGDKHSLPIFTKTTTEVKAFDSLAEEAARAISRAPKSRIPVSSARDQTKQGASNTQLPNIIHDSLEEIVTPAADVRNTILAPAKGGNDMKKVDTFSHQLRRPTSVKGPTSSSSMTETTPFETSNSDGRVADVYLLVVIIFSCLISVMGLIIAFLCWSKLKSQAQRLTDSEYSYRHLSPKEDNNTVNGYTSSQQAELYMYNQKRQQIKSSHTSFSDYQRDFDVLGEMQYGVHGVQVDLQPGEDEDTIYETPGLSHVEDIKIVNPVYRPTHQTSSISTRSTGTSSPVGSN